MKWSFKPCIIRTKKISKALRQEIVDWIMKNSNVRQYPITRDTLIITDADADTKVKRRVPKLLLECSMRQLHNELIASPDDGGLVGARHAITNDVIVSDTMLRSLAPPQLRRREPPSRNGTKSLASSGPWPSLFLDLVAYSAECKKPFVIKPKVD